MKPMNLATGLAGGLALLALAGCGEHVASVEHGDMVSTSGGSYATRPDWAANHVAKVRFYKAMGAAFQQAERETDNAKAKDLFTGQRKGWKGFGYLAAGQGGSYVVPGYKWEAMREALGTLPVETCKAVTSQIIEAYVDLRNSLKDGSRQKHKEAAEGAFENSKTWLNRFLRVC